MSTPLQQSWLPGGGIESGQALLEQSYRASDRVERGAPVSDDDGRIRVCVAGITGWTGRPIAEAIAAASDLQLVSGVSRTATGRTISDALHIEGAGGTVFGTVGEALDGRPVDVLVDFTSAETVKGNVLAAIRRRAHVVNGSSGLTADDYAAIERLAIEHQVGVVAMANASIMAALLQRFAVQAAQHLPSWEIVDYASANKIDVPSGTCLLYTSPSPRD